MKTVVFASREWTTAMADGRIMNSSNPWQWYDDDCVNIINNNAYLSVKKKSNHIKYYDGREFDPVVATGVMRSVETFGYGTFKANIKLPCGFNLWPAFWLVGEGKWPDNGEIDICEGWTNAFGYFRLSGWRTTNNIHFADYDTHQDIGCKNVPFCKSLLKPSENFIEYEVKWEPDSVAFYVNGKAVRNCKKDIAQYLRDKKMHVVFDFWTQGEDFNVDSNMIINNFYYKPL